MATDPTNDHNGARPYVIRLTGELDTNWQAWFEGLTVQPQGDGTTVITGPITDQAALHGVLQRIRDLGMPLISVNRIESCDPAADRRTPDQPPIEGDQT